MSTLYSSHIFMFPFRFDWNEKGFENEFVFYREKTISERLNFRPESFEGWKLEPFDLQEHPELYNEYAYFYDYARDAIYNIKGDPYPISYYYERETDLTNATYMIHIKQYGKSYTYALNLVGLSLRVFDSGVAILSLELENRSYDDFRDILRINDFGRRIYPQYIKDKSTDETKNSFLADSITVNTSTIDVTENFDFKPSDDIVIGEHIMKLLGESFSQSKMEAEKFFIQPILDDRMFVLSWCQNSELSKQLIDEKYIENDEWYQYVFVDNNEKTVFSPKMQEKLIKNATYDRWMNYKYNGQCALTLYGVCRYSFVCLSTSDFPKMHMHTMYFQMVTLLLAIRASILRFSDEIAAVASKKEIDRLETLYEKYLTFYNRLYFKEVTHQDQGIELYDMARKQMRIDEHIKKLDNKFTKLFAFSNLQAEKESGEKMDHLTMLGTVFLPPSIIIALLSMGIFDYNKSVMSLVIGVGAAVLSAYLGYHYVKHLNIKDTNEK